MRSPVRAVLTAGAGLACETRRGQEVRALKRGVSREDLDRPQLEALQDAPPVRRPSEHDEEVPAPSTLAAALESEEMSGEHACGGVDPPLLVPQSSTLPPAGKKRPLSKCSREAVRQVQRQEQERDQRDVDRCFGGVPRSSAPAPPGDAPPYRCTLCGRVRDLWTHQCSRQAQEAFLVARRAVEEEDRLLPQGDNKSRRKNKSNV